MIPIRRLSLSEQAHDRKSRQIKRFAAAAASTNGDEDAPSIRGKFTRTRRLLVMSCLAHSDRLLMIAGKRIRVAEDAKALRERVQDLNLDEMDVDQLNAILAAAGQADD